MTATSESIAELRARLEREAQEQMERLQPFLRPVPFGAWAMQAVYRKPTDEYVIVIQFDGYTERLMTPERWSQCPATVSEAVSYTAEQIARTGDSWLGLEVLHILDRWFRHLAELTLDIKR